jgi:hypothetical protein
MPVAKIAEVTFTSTDRVRDVLHNFTADGFDSLYSRSAGGRPPKFDLKQQAAGEDQADRAVPAGRA